MLLLILVGFTMAIMATLGVALLILGEVPFINGKRIPAMRSRFIGLVLLSFGPLAFGVRQLLNVLVGTDSVDGQAVTWSVFGGCCFLVIVLLFRVMVPRRQPRPTSKSAAPNGEDNPFGDSERNSEPSDTESDSLPWLKQELPPMQKPKPPASARSAITPKTPTRSPQKPSSGTKDPFDFT